MFSSKFLRFAVVDGRPAGAGPCGQDRILACVGTESIPVSNDQDLKEERPAKAAGRSSRFIAQGLRSGASPKKMGLFLMLFGRTSSDSREREAKRREGMNDPSGTASPCRRVIADFLRSQLRRIGLGHPLGRDPSRISMPAIQTNPANGIGHQPGLCNPFGKLLRWLFVRCVSSTP